MQVKKLPKMNISTVSRIRTCDLPTLERERFRNLGMRERRNLGYQVGCADHCTTTAFFGWRGHNILQIYSLREFEVTAKLRGSLSM